jgi:putative DNA primase/helicase
MKKEELIERLENCSDLLPELPDLLDEGFSDFNSSAENSKNNIQQKDPTSFFDRNRFVPRRVVEVLVKGNDYFHDGTEFYTYNASKGVWNKIHENIICQKIITLLGDYARRHNTEEVLKLLKIETYKNSDELKPNRYLINLKNGMLDIHEQITLPHNKNYFSKIQIKIEYDPGASRHKWEQFLNEVCLDDPIKILSLQDFAGYCLYPEIFIHKCLFLLGQGANGKSVFINTLQKIIGKENCSNLEIHQFSDKFQLGHLKDKLLNVSTEVDTKKKIESSIFKQVVSGDPIHADKKYRNPFSFRPIAKHIFSLNETPLITDRSHALSRRLIIVKFNKVFKEIEQNKNLEKELTDELSGILSWCLEGLKRVIETEEITESDIMKKDKEKFELSLNNVRAFVEDECKLGEEFKVFKKELFDSYKEYCDESRIRPFGRNKFYDQLTKDFPSVTENKESGGERHFKGIKIRISEFGIDL